jgi:hypothetical protein
MSFERVGLGGAAIDCGRAQAAEKKLIHEAMEN